MPPETQLHTLTACIICMLCHISAAEWHFWLVPHVFVIEDALILSFTCIFTPPEGLLAPIIIKIGVSLVPYTCKVLVQIL